MGKNVHAEVDRDRAQAFARSALLWLNQNSIPPTPDNFELAYNLIGGEHSELMRTVDELSSKGCKFDSSIMAVLHHRYFQTPRHEQTVTELGEKMTAELDTVLKVLDSA